MQVLKPSTAGTNYQCMLLSNAGKLDAHNLFNALKEVSDWHKLGVLLGIPPSELRKIEQDYQGSDRRKTETLDLWLCNTPSATWSTVESALQEMNQHTVAETIHQKYIQGATSTFTAYSPFLILHSKASIPEVYSESLHDINIH